MTSDRDPLFDARGGLDAGWAPRPRWRYDPDAIGRRLRRKEWDFYGVTTRDHYVAIVIAHGGVAGVIAVQWIDLVARTRVVEQVALTPLGRGVVMPVSSERGDLRFASARRGVAIDIAHAGGGARTIRVDWRDRVELELELDAARGIAVVAPLGGGAFYYNHKVPAIPARGWIRAGAAHAGHAALTARVDLDGFATLDWGRGVWPHRTSWRWAVAQGRLADGRRVGLTLGDVSADADAAREDALLVDDLLTKLAPVAIDFDRDDSMRPWRITGVGVDLTVTPRFDNGRGLPIPGARTELRQALGVVHGTVVSASGERISLGPDGLPGWAEDLRARW